jgi:hypothetical protein
MPCPRGEYRLRKMLLSGTKRAVWMLAYFDYAPRGADAPKRSTDSNLTSGSMVHTNLERRLEERR